MTRPVRLPSARAAHRHPLLQSQDGIRRGNDPCQPDPEPPIRRSHPRITLCPHSPRHSCTLLTVACALVCGLLPHIAGAQPRSQGVDRPHQHPAARQGTQVLPDGGTCWPCHCAASGSARVLLGSARRNLSLSHTGRRSVHGAAGCALSCVRCAVTSLCAHAHDTVARVNLGLRWPGSRTPPRVTVACGAWWCIVRSYFRCSSRCLPRRRRSSFTAATVPTSCTF
jgi:hypothetical protein